MVSYCVECWDGMVCVVWWVVVGLCGVLFCRVVGFYGVAWCCMVIVKWWDRMWCAVLLYSILWHCLSCSSCILLTVLRIFFSRLETSAGVAMTAVLVSAVLEELVNSQEHVLSNLV